MQAEFRGGIVHVLFEDEEDWRRANVLAAIRSLALGPTVRREDDKVSFEPNRYLFKTEAGLIEFLHETCATTHGMVTTSPNEAYL